MRLGVTRLHLYVLFIYWCCQAFPLVTRAAEGHGSSWPACSISAPDLSAGSPDAAQAQQIARITLPSSPSGCSLVFASGAGAEAAGAKAQRLAPGALIAGVYDGTVGRPPVVQLRTDAAAGEAALLVPAGGKVVLQDLLLSDVTLSNPKINPSQAFLPTALQLPAGSTLQLIDVKMMISRKQLQDYIVFVMAYPQIVQWTDGVSFLHIRSYSSSLVNGSAGAVEGSTLTLLAPEGAKINGTPLPILQSVSGGSQSNGVDPAAVRAAQGDEAGVVTVTDSYVLGATNATLVKLIQQVASQQELKVPALIFIATNVTLSPAGGGPEWVPGGVKIKRPVVWVGSSWRNTSIDFHMEVGQFVLDGPTANVTLVNLVLENLAYGDEISARDAEGKSLSRSHILWSFRFRRSQPRLVLVDDVMDFPEQIQVDNAAYWTDAFNSDLDFWRNQTAFMRDILGIQLQKYKRGKNPGEYIMDIIKKDQLMTNVTYTARPYVAPPLPLVINPTLHSDIVTYRADPGVGPVYTREDVAVTLFNVRRIGCQRSYILLPTAPSGGVVDWSPTELAFNSAHPVAPTSAHGALNASGPQPLRASQLPTDASGTKESSSSAAGEGEGLARTWPSPGGELVKCPVQFRGVSSSDQPSTVIDLGFARGLLRLEDSSSGPTGPQPGGSPGSQAGPPPLSGQAAAPQSAIRTPLLQFGSLVFRSLPQGAGFGGVASADSSSTGGGSSAGSAAAPAAAPGGVGSGLPAEAYTHLLWFVTRDITGGSAITLTNVTLQLPPAESAQMESAAQAAIAAAGSSDAAVLSMVYPTANGSLPVVYRSLWFSNGPSYAASSGDYASLFVGRRRRMLQLPASAQESSTTAAGPHGHSRVLLRRLLQISSSAAAAPVISATAAPSAAASVRMLCVGSLEGLGLSGRNICMAAQDAGAPLPPGYLWPATTSSASSNWAPWKAALVAISVAVVCLAAAWGVIAVRRKKRQQQQLAAEKYALRSGSGSDGRMDLESVNGHRDQSSGGHSIKTSAAAMAAASGLLAASSTSSATLRKLAQTLDNMSAGAADTTDSASSVTVAAAASGGSKGKDLDTAPYASANSKGGTTASDKLRQEHSVTVGLGEELGRLAAIHQSLLSPAAVDDGEEAYQRAVAQQAAAGGALAAGTDPRNAQQQQQQGDLQALRSASSLQQQQQQPSTVQRLSSAITAVSAEMHMRRLGGHTAGHTAAAGASDTAASSNTGLAGAQGSDLNSIAVAAACRGKGPVAQQQQQQCAVSTPVQGKAESGGPPVSREGSGSSTGSQQQQQLRQLQLHEVIGSGTFGVVYRATWQGIPAAVKVMQLPAAAAGSGEIAAGGLEVCCSRREQMAVMETALGSSLSHPNIVQVYTYHLRPLGQAWPSEDGAATAAADGSSGASAAADEAVAASLMRHSSVRKGSGGSSGSTAVTGYELQLVMEYCPLGSLRAAIDNCLLEDRLTGRPQYLTVLSLALGVARAMHHLHSEGVLHGDLKAGNVLLKMEVISAAVSAGTWTGPFGGVNQTREVLVSKVADFGLACRISDQDTHISGVHRGTLSHMSPELLVHGRASRASDVYAMGILLWEMATGLKAFAGVPKAMLGAAVVRDKARPEWPCSNGYFRQPAARSLGADGSSSSSGSSGRYAEMAQPPLAYRQLAARCWAHEAQDRPTFADITATLQLLLQEEQQQLASMAARSQQEQQRWAAAAAQASTAAAAGASPRSRTHKAGAVEAVRKLLGPTPSSAKSPDQAAPAPIAAAAPADPAAAAAAGWPKRQRSVSFADAADTPAGSAAAAAATAGSSSGSSRQRQGSSSPIGSGSLNCVTNGQRNGLSNKLGVSPVASNTALSGVPTSTTIRQAAVAAVAAVLQEPAIHGNGAWLTRGLSGRLYSVQEDAAEEQLAAAMAATAAAGSRGEATAAAAAVPGIADGVGGISSRREEIPPAGGSGGSPFDAMKSNPWS